MQKIISISQSVAADKAGYEFLCELYKDMHDVEKDEIYINFGRCRDFDANLSAVLGAIFDKRQKEGCPVFFNLPQHPGVRRFLSRNKFLQAFNHKTTNEDRENFIEYKKFGISDTQAFKEYIDKELIQKKLFPDCTEKAKNKIIESIYEIFANAVSHGGCDNVYCCGEVHPRKGKTMLDMTIVNLGLSVVDNVNRYMQEKMFPIYTSCEALDWAFEEGHTTKQDTGGLGLSILKDFIKMNEGTIQMISGDAMLEIEGETHNKTQLNKWFPGTIVTVEFNCDDNKMYFTEDEVPDMNNLF